MSDPILGFFHRWLQKMASRVDSLLVICLLKGEYNLPKNVLVLSLGKEGGAGRITYLWRFYKYIWQFRKQYSGVFIHMNPEYAILGGPFWRLWRKKILLWYVHKAVNLKLRLAEKLVHKIFTASKESFRLPSRKAEVVGHGIDTALFKPSTQYLNEELRMLTVGRISPSKDLKTLIWAVYELARGGVIMASLDIVGAPITKEDKDYLALLRQIVLDNNLSNVVSFLGPKIYSELPEIYLAHNLFVHASRTGSMDKVVLEALASGLPVLTSSAVYDKFPGIFKFNEADYRDLAQKIEENFLSGRIVYNEAGEKFVKENFNLDKLIDKIVSFLKRI